VYEYGNPAQAVKVAQSSPVPQYGGDCALKQDGLGSSLQRLQDVTLQLNNATWQLRDLFGMSVPADAPANNCKAPSPNGVKGLVDEAAHASRASLENVHLILEHLRS
jgi:hypothetical protein